MTICPYCRAPAQFPQVLVTDKYICGRCRRLLEFRVGNPAFLGVFTGATTWLALVLTHRSMGGGGSLVVGAIAGCVSGSAGTYLFGWLQPASGGDDKPAT